MPPPKVTRCSNPHDFDLPSFGASAPHFMENPSPAWTVNAAVRHVAKLMKTVFLAILQFLFMLPFAFAKKLKRRTSTQCRRPVCA
jgi:hypothetical protein